MAKAVNENDRENKQYGRYLIKEEKWQQGFNNPQEENSEFKPSSSDLGSVRMSCPRQNTANTIAVHLIYNPKELRDSGPWSKLFEDHPNRPKDKRVETLRRQKRRWGQ